MRIGYFLFLLIHHCKMYATFFFVYLLATCRKEQNMSLNPTFLRVCFRMSYKSCTLAWFLIDPENV